MSQRQVLMVLGVWVAVLPFLGFPLGWEKILECLSGLLIVVLVYRLRSESSAKNDPASASFTEHRSVSIPKASREADVDPANSKSSIEKDASFDSAASAASAAVRSSPENKPAAETAETVITGQANESQGSTEGSASQ